MPSIYCIVPYKLPTFDAEGASAETRLTVEQVVVVLANNGDDGHAGWI